MESSARRGGRRLAQDPEPGKNIKRGPAKKLRGVSLRIIGGDLRGRPIAYHGERFTRPMKDKIRESLFNILGNSLRDAIVLDLFAGTGALAMEAISRGARCGIAIEQRVPAAETIRKTLQTFGIDQRLRVMIGDAFRLGPAMLESCQQPLATFDNLLARGGFSARDGGAVPHDSGDVTRDIHEAEEFSTEDFEAEATTAAIDVPWIVFFCPPYAMWETHWDSLHRLLDLSIGHAPPGSRLVIEAEKGFDPDRLPGTEWDIRRYGNTLLGIYKPGMVCGMNL
ncbi:MAG: RsmD family RNA methyltransferase [Planctomycetota bacterium]